MPTTTKSLDQKINTAVAQLLREHLAECEASAAAAVQAAFAGAARGPTKSARGRRGRPPAARRSREELDALEERLYDAIRRHPGETMTVLAPVVGATARELNRQVRSLRRGGRVRSVGERQSTRYFPMGE